MRKSNNMNKYIGFAASILFLLLAGCSDLSDSPSETSAPADYAKSVFTVGGKISLGAAIPAEIAASLNEENAQSRSATSSFATDLDYLVRAYRQKETTDATGATVYEDESTESISGRVNKADKSWSVDLNQEGFWKIEISLWQSGVPIMLGQTDETEPVYVDSAKFFNQKIERDITLTPNYVNAVDGSISLEIYNESSDVTSVEYSWIKPEATTWPETLTEGNASFSGGKTTLTFDSVKWRLYEIALLFKSPAGKTLYSCREKIPVFSGFATDTWYGTSPYLQKIEDGDGNITTKFVITDELLNSYSRKDILGAGEYPIILYDRDYLYKKTEFENPRPGFNVFTSVSAGAAIGDGLTFAKGRTVVDFAIDSATQEIYTLEKDAKNIACIFAKYPSYAGYEKGKNITTTSTNKFCAYDGVLFTLQADGLKKFSDEGNEVVFALKDSSGNALTFDSVPGDSVPVFDVHGEYFYTAEYTQASSSEPYCLTVRKFQLVDNGAGPLAEEVASTSKTESELGVYVDGDDYQLHYQYKLEVTDIQVDSDGNVYVLVCEHGKKSYPDKYYSRGGIIKIIDNEGSLSFHDFKAEGASASVYIFGWAYSAYHPEEGSPTCSDSMYFYGCTKFLAKKPDELVIADEGAYKYEIDELDEYGNKKKVKVNKNRVVKVNLRDFSMETIDVNVGFDSYFRDSGDDFDGYTGSSYSND